MKKRNDSIGGILVVYNADQNELRRVVEALASQLDVICIVDNSSADNSSFYSKQEKIIYMPQLKNLGVATAQNIAIDCLRSNGIRYAFFCDQDSDLPAEIVESLYDLYQRIESKGIKVASVSPRPFNKETGKLYPHQVNFLAGMKIREEIISEVTFTMSSCSLVKLANFDLVGPFEDALFIDGVDSEWGWRARHYYGLRSFVSENLLFGHMLGNGIKRVAGKDRSLTPPYRLQYQYRNYIWMAKRNYVPWKWKVYNGMKYVAKIIYYGILSSDRKENIRYIIAGVKNGIWKDEVCN